MLWEFRVSGPNPVVQPKPHLYHLWTNSLIALSNFSNVKGKCKPNGHSPLVVLSNVKRVVIHDFPDFLLKNADDFCWDKQMGLIQIIDDKLLSQSHLLIKMKKELFNSWITVRKWKLIPLTFNYYNYSLKSRWIFTKPQSYELNILLLFTKIEKNNYYNNCFVFTH